jgi:predicted double-glycine peptidase
MSTSTKLDVPYYQQTHYATCGPAALMMVMKYWDASKDFSREMEMNIWKKARSLIFKGATFQFGLSNSAKRLGFNSVIYQKAKISSYKNTWKNLFDVFEFLYSAKIRISKIPIFYGKNSMDVIIEALERKIPPLVFINLEPISGENIFHWIVVTGVDKETVIFNDPDISEKPRKDVKVKKEIFEKAIATDVFSNITFPFSMFRFPPAIVLVYK